MLKLIPEKDSNQTYSFLAGKKYTVGRKTGDVVFPDDQSISRNHAEIEVDFPRANLDDPSLLPTLNVTDLGSKFGSFFNIEGQENDELVAMNMRDPVSLVHGNTVRFGRQWNQFKVQYTPMVACASTLGEIDKKEVKDNLWKLGGHFESDWSSNVNFVVMSEVTLTTKAVCGLLAGNYIVTPKYLKDLVVSIENNQPSPKPRDYEPKFVESIATTNVNLRPNPARRKLFVGKTFIFSNIQQARRLKAAVQAGGGAFKLIKDCTEVIAESSESLMFESPSKSFFESHAKRCLDAYSKSGKRFITEADVSMAALDASVTKHCNPYSKHSQRMFAPMSSQTQTSQAETAAVIVPETQPEFKTPLNDNSRMVVDESLNISAGSDKSFSSSSSRQRTDLDFKSRGTKHFNTGEDDDNSSAKRRLRSTPDTCSSIEPSQKRARQTVTGKNSQITNSRSTRSKMKTKSLSAIFGMSDSDEEDDDVIPGTHEDSQSQSQLRPTNISAVPATDFDFVGIKGKHIKSPSKSALGGSKKNETTSVEGTPYVDFVPGTPDASDEDDQLFAGLVDPSEVLEVSHSSSVSKRKVSAIVNLEDDNPIDTSAMPTMKMATLSTCQLPTLAVSESVSSRKRKAEETKSVAIKTEGGESVTEKPKLKNKGDLMSWVTSSKRNNSFDDEGSNAGENSKKRRVNLDDEVDVKPKIKIETEGKNEEPFIVTPAPFQVVSLMKSLPEMPERKPPSNGSGSSVPNFKTFRKVMPLCSINSFEKRPGLKSTKRNQSTVPLRLIPAGSDYIDSANITIDQQENSQQVQPITNGTSNSATQMPSTSGSTTGKLNLQSTPVPLVVDVDPDVFGSEQFDFEEPKEVCNNNFDPSEGMFDFD